jgi:pimeloyl-ACP methyl ester carboxylesterase
MKTLSFAMLMTLFAVPAFARPVFVFSNGFGSCFMAGQTDEVKASRFIDDMVEQVTDLTGQEPVVVRTCYALGSNDIFVTATELDHTSERMTREDFHEVVKAAVQLAGDNAPVYVWGHSHGGWTAMDLVRKVGELNYRNLVTVDPISVVNCGPVVFSGGVITGDAPGCREAPSDLASAGPMIAQRAKHWTNWFQLEFPLLHSESISTANENLERAYDANWTAIMGAHAVIEVDADIWQQTAQYVVDDIQR